MYLRARNGGLKRVGVGASSTGRKVPEGSWKRWHLSRSSRKEGQSLRFPPISTSPVPLPLAGHLLATPCYPIPFNTAIWLPGALSLFLAPHCCICWSRVTPFQNLSP